MEILLILYSIAGYWAAGLTIFYNKIVIHKLGGLFIAKLMLGICFGYILIPIAIILKIIRAR